LNEFLDQPTAVRPCEELDVERLQTYLAAHLPEASGPLTVRQFPSGHSNLTYCLQCGRRQWILRRPPFGSKVKGAHDMGREYRILSKLHVVYPPAPEPLWFCDDPSVTGDRFYLMRRIEGIILRKDPPAGLEIDAATARRLSQSLVDNLAVLHGLDYEAAGLGELGKPAGYVTRQVNGWIKRYAGSRTHDIPEVDRVSAWLVERMPGESGAALVHNDYKYDNLVLDAGDVTRIVGLLDWEMSTLGDPLMDLATALAYWVEADDPPDLQQLRWNPTSLPGSLSRAEIVSRYAAQTGRDASNIVYHYVFALFKVGVIVQQIYYRYHHGLTSDARFAPLIDVARRLFRASLRAMERDQI